MSGRGKELTWGQALAQFIGVMAAVYVVILLSHLTMVIPNVLAIVYLVYILVFERPAGSSG